MRALALLVLLAAPARAELKFSGYLKDFWQYSRGVLDRRPYNLNTARARLTVDAAYSRFRSNVSYDHQWAAGSYFRTRDFKTFGYEPPRPWLEMQQTISTGVLNGYGHGVYRGWVGVEDERGALRAGRQRIAWGTGKLWNPVDVLNPYDPATIERDERRGVDALYARAALGTLGQAELAWAPDDRWPEHAVLGRLRGGLEGWGDASILGGKVAGSTGSVMVGGDFAGTVLDGTLHGEAAWFDPEWRPGYWKAGLGWDYTRGDHTVVLEGYHSGRGTTDPRRYDFASVRAGREVSVGRNYLGGSLSSDVHPLLKLELFGLANVDDGSSLVSPSGTWNAVEDFYLTLAFQRFGGGERTEYGRIPNILVITGQYYF